MSDKKCNCNEHGRVKCPACGGKKVRQRFGASESTECPFCKGNGMIGEEEVAKMYETITIDIRYFSNMVGTGGRSADEIIATLSYCK